MRKSAGWVIVIVLGLVLSGCVSDRATGPEPTATADSSLARIPTLPPLAELPPTPTPEPTSTPEPTPTPMPTPTPDPLPRVTPRLDADLAIPREYLEGLGLMPAESGPDIFYEIARDYDGTLLFANYWGLPRESSGHIFYVREYRYIFLTSAAADEFLLQAAYGLTWTAKRAGNEIENLSDDIHLGDESLAQVFTTSGQRIYAAQFVAGQTGGIILIAGDEELTQEQAFDIFSLAVESLESNPTITGTPTPSAGESG